MKETVNILSALATRDWMQEYRHDQVQVQMVASPTAGAVSFGDERAGKPAENVFRRQEKLNGKK